MARKTKNTSKANPKAIPYTAADEWLLDGSKFMYGEVDVEVSSV